MLPRIILVFHLEHLFVRVLHIFISTNRINGRDLNLFLPCGLSHIKKHTYYSYKMHNKTNFEEINVICALNLVCFTRSSVPKRKYSKLKKYIIASKC